MIGWLDDDAVSLTYDAARGVVTRHAGGAAEVVGDDPFAVLESELAAGSPDDQWFGYFGYAARPDLPAAVGGPAARRGLDAGERDPLLHPPGRRRLGRCVITIRTHGLGS